MPEMPAARPNEFLKKKKNVLFFEFFLSFFFFQFRFVVSFHLCFKDG